MMKLGLTIVVACLVITVVSGKTDPDPDPDPPDDTATTTTTEETTTVVHGNWGEWGAYSSCSANCGTGTQYRSRSCNNPAPSGGDDCVGDSTESQSCDAGAECCAPQVFDVVLLMDVTFTSTQHARIVTFFKDVVGIFEIAPSKTRMSLATVGSTTSLSFSFTEYTTDSEITTAIDDISREWSTANSKDALDFVRGTMLTTENGARSDVGDVLIMLISNVNTDEVDVSAQKLKDNGVTLMIVEETLSWSQTSKLEDLADLYADFSYSYYTDTLGPVKDNIQNGFPCNYFCATSFFALDSPSTLSTGNDPSVGYLYLMTDTPYQASCCGATSAWEFYAVSSGTVEMMVFRQTGENTYYLVGYSTIIVPVEYVGTSVSFPLTATERIAIVSGDLVGWYTSGANIIGHADCDTSSRADCPQNNKRISMPGATFTVGQSIDFSSSESIPNRGYSIKVATTNNSELVLTAIQNETEIEENTPTGYKVLYFRVTDPDLNDNTTWELSGQSSLFVMSDLVNDQVQLLLQTKLPDGGGSYIITVKGTDSCQHTASATVTVSTYNAPPVINNLPYILEISETTDSAIHLYTINVTDATNDPICCTMPYSLPVSNNFEFRSTGGVYSLWTVNEPAFAYNDINAYRIFVCCQDDFGSSTLYLMLQILENKIEVPYVPPSWFYTAIIVSMMPIAIMAMLSCATLIITMFFLDGDKKVEEDDTALSELTDTTSNGPDNEVTSPSLTENSSTAIETVEETIQFKNLYNDEVVNIPIWRGKWKRAANAIGTINAWRGMAEHNRTIEFADDPYLEPRTKGDAFGVELKLFHYGGRPIHNVSEEEKAASIFQKKNTMKEKWLETIEKAKKKKIVKMKSATNKVNVSDDISNVNKEEFKEPVEKVSLERTIVSIENTDTKSHDIVKEEMTNETNNTEDMVTIETDDMSNETNNTEDVVTIETEDMNNVSNENNSPEEVDDEDIFNIFNEIVEPGTAAAGTQLKK